MLFLYFTLFTTLVQSAENDKRNYDIFTLSNTFYGNFIDNEEIVFLKYYAPWCGHCKQLAPIFVELAKEFHGRIKFAEINCDENREICDKEDLQGFPTLALFRRDRYKQVYKGERTFEKMKTWLDEMLLPPIVDIPKAKIAELQQKVDYSFILLDAEPDDPIRRKLVEIADTVDYLKIYAVNSELDGFTIKVWNGEKKMLLDYPSSSLADFDVKNFVEWANIETFPTFHHVNMPLIKRCDNMPLYMVWYFYEGKIPEMHQTLFKELGLEYKGKFVFFHFNKAMSEEQVMSLHQSGNVYPCLSVIHKNKRNIYAMDDKLPINKETVTKYLESILSGETKPNLRKTDPIKDEDQKGPLYKLTGHNFDQFISKEKKDILIVFCSERAEVCNYFMSNPLKNVYERMKKIETFEMAWIDASTDDVSEKFNLDNIPKLYLISNTENGQKIEEMKVIPSEENTMKFIEEFAQYKFEMPPELEKKEDNEKKVNEEKKEEKKEENQSDSEDEEIKEIDEELMKKEL